MSDRVLYCLKKSAIFEINVCLFFIKDYDNNQLRRDSASSSDHSSMSSATSNNGSPYASHVNVNGMLNFYI